MTSLTQRNPHPLDSSNMLGRFIRQRRTDLGLTQTELSLLTGIGQGNISDLERGRISIPGVAMRRKIASALGIGQVDLLVAAGELSDEDIRETGLAFVAPSIGSVRRDWMNFSNGVPEELLEAMLVVCRGMLEQSRKHGSITPLAALARGVRAAGESA